MTLLQYRQNIKVKWQKSALFPYKNEIFDAIDMSMSHQQIHYFLTSQKGLKISVRAVSKWIKTHKNTNQKVPIFAPIQKQEQKEANTTVTQKNESVKQPKGEPTTLSKVDDRALKVRKKMGAATDGLPDGLLEMFSHTILKN